MGNPELATKVEQFINAEPHFFAEIITQFSDGYAYRDLLLAWSDIREKNILKRDQEGRYFIEAGL